ncbi:MAG: ABC transporter permease [Bacteriovoracaceae bacterium]
MTEKLVSLVPYWLVILVIFFFFRVRQKDLAKDILWASFRTTLQLIFLAFALNFIFQNSLLITSLIVSIIMTINSSLQICSRSKYKLKNLFWNSLFSNTMAIWPIAFLFSYEQSPNEWSDSKILIPLMGMLLGNTLSGASIGIDSFLTSMKEKKDEVMTLLALGATPNESTKKVFYRALRQGISPQINSMLSMGIVSIPGMMTGQLLAKANVFDASITQVKMMLAICAGTIFTIFLTLKFCQRKMFLPTGELCLE